MTELGDGSYVALGSSFASGPGIEPVIDVGCGRSANNYAHHTAARLGLDLTDVTCGGATVDTILRVPQTLMTGDAVPPQIEAVGPGTSLVTVTVGGNDIGYMQTLGQCCYAVEPLPAPDEVRAFLTASVDRGAVDAALASLPACLAELVRAIRARAPEARIVLVDYLTVVPGSADAALPVSEADRVFCADIAGRLEAATATAAREASAELVLASELSRDHAVGAAEPWVTGWEAGDPMAGGVVPFHPNAAGMRAVAAALTEMLRG